MGNIVFFILLIILIAALIASGYHHEKKKKTLALKKLTGAFGKRDVIVFEKKSPDSSPLLFEKLKNSSSYKCVDDITVSDLSLYDLYDRMNRTVTPCGEDMLYCHLRLMADNGKKPENLYDRVKEYSEDKQLYEHLLAILSKVKKSKNTDLFACICRLEDAKEEKALPDILLLAVLVISVILIAFLPLWGFALTIVMIIVNIYTYFAGRGHMDDNLRALGGSLRMAECADELASFQLTEFERYRDLLKLKRGNFLISFRDATTSDPLSIILDYVRMLTHIDLIAYKLKIRSIKTRIKELKDLYFDIGRTDMALSVASFVSGSRFCRADLTNERRITGKNIYHPLLRDPVCNDIDAKRGIILTGSNASGKSTFLKSVGINVLLSQSLGLAFADSFSTAPFSLYTSMALSDNLLGSESYYVVEARSIKRMADAAISQMCFCIIDEVLRGTNTVERIAAGSRILQSLEKKGVLVFCATHDRELTMLLEGFDTYHFTEDVEGETVKFPYKIREGVSDTTNAIRLLSVMGYDGDVVRQADELAEKYKKTGKWV